RDVADVAALGPRPGIVGLLPRDRGEVGSGSELRERRFRLFLRRRSVRSRDAEEDVTDADLLEGFALPVGLTDLLFRRGEPGRHPDVQALALLADQLLLDEADDNLTLDLEHLLGIVRIERACELLAPLDGFELTVELLLWDAHAVDRCDAGREVAAARRPRER